MTVKHEATQSDISETERKEELVRQIMKIQKDLGENPEVREVIELLVQKGEEVLRTKLSG